MPKYSYKDGTTYTAKNQVDGVLIDPKLPARFDNTPNEKRPDSQTKWWAFPFIVTDGEAYETRCLHLATATLESAPMLARLFRLTRYRQAKIIHAHATRRFQDVARRSPHHHQAAEQLAKAIKDNEKRPANAR